MDKYIQLIESFDNKNKYYWINVLVKQGLINKSIAGFLITYFNL